MSNDFNERLRNRLLVKDRFMSNIMDAVDNALLGDASVLDCVVWLGQLDERKIRELRQRRADSYRELAALIESAEED